WTDDSRTTAPGQRRRYSHFNPGDSKSLPNNRTAKVHLFINLGMPLQSDNRKFYDYLTIKATTVTIQRLGYRLNNVIKKNSEQL
ncbi:MAG: hypothetical protein IKT19_01840, partial [Paludibacteraceae bacterium]|nr:hypothetical protein [Paludibacteraceae bacterium]